MRRELLNYAEFLRDCGNLYLEGEGAELLSNGVAPVADKSTPPAPGENLSNPASRPLRATNPNVAQPPPAARFPGNANLPIGGGAPSLELTPRTSSQNESQPPSVAQPRETSKKPLPADQDDFLQATSAPPPVVGSLLSEKDRTTRAEKAKQAAEACRACSLGHGRTQAVYGTGSIMAKIMFVGEAPGADEDASGIPFIGRAGQLLTKMIQAIGFSRDEVYICNTIKCRPPENRDPLPGEKAACEHFLAEQIELIRPQMIVALGAHAACYLSGQETSIGKLRRKWMTHRGIPLMATYHPAFLLRSPSFKTQAWEDLQMLAKKYGELNPADPRRMWEKQNS